MRTTIDAAGRIVIPKKIRDRAGMTPGAEVEIKECDGHVEIEAIWEEPRLEWRGRFLVIVPPEGTPAMTGEESEAIRRGIYEERARRAWGVDD